MINVKESVCTMAAGMGLYLLSAIFWMMWYPSGLNSFYMVYWVMSLNVIKIISLVSLIMIVIGAVGIVYNLYIDRKERTTN
ncbi:hypothetical protein [Candidatus Methanarcanum hacksteinii]|uniref:hypothetical protein n=1 Tax=Candidatus Methanarcanum hacksteinii TaxID=2911857 RepID=UPI0037DCFCEB